MLIKRFSRALSIVTEELDFEFEEMTAGDYKRTLELLDTYADSGIDYVDAVVVAMAERLGTLYVMTVGEADFRRYVPALDPPHFVLPIFDL